MNISLRRRDPASAQASAAERDAAALADVVHECQVAGIARHACVVHLSRLPSNRVRPHHLRMARAALEPLSQADRGRLFTLPSLDIVVVWRNASVRALSQSRDAIMLLFANDDMASAALQALWEDLTLPVDGPRLLTLVEPTTAPDEEAAFAPAQEVEPQTIGGLPLDPVALAALEANLAQADMTRFARRRPVAERLADGRFRRRWERRVLCIDEIAETLAPDYTLQLDRVLFRRLTRTLDRRMLALLAAPDELTLAGPFSVNLNVASILAQEFVRFDAALPNALRNRVILDLSPADILADPAAFLFARDFAHDRGYALALHGVSADIVDQLPRRVMGLEWLSLRWSEALYRADHGAIMADAESLVLTHAHTQAAINWGVARGITMFEGRVVSAALRGVPRGA